MTTPVSTTSAPTATPTVPTSTSRAHTPTAPTTPQSVHPLRRIAVIARAETTLFFRNRTVLLNALLLAPAMAAVLAPLMLESVGADSFAVLLIQLLVVFGLMFVIYYNFTSIMVAHRESGIFQRMKTSQASEWEALIAALIPSTIVLLVQAVIGLALVGVIGGMNPVTNPVALLVGIIGGTVVFAGLGAWTSSWSSTVESAQYSTMPVLLVAMFFGGVFMPVQYMPETLQAISSYSPLYAVNTLVGIGMVSAPALDGGGALTLAESFTAMGKPALALAVWIIVALYAARGTRFARRA